MMFLLLINLYFIRIRADIGMDRLVDEFASAAGYLQDEVVEGGAA
jgi:hypothetical protein